ncbi:hypothetical protein C8R45DRAFT_943134 [Mycena sanguinolenta]|nr:hypothetical protein C8R45DRAFT_943134 [Mycena sanguinolenta]
MIQPRRRATETNGDKERRGHNQRRCDAMQLRRRTDAVGTKIETVGTEPMTRGEREKSRGAPAAAMKDERDREAAEMRASQRLWTCGRGREDPRGDQQDAGRLAGRKKKIENGAKRTHDGYSDTWSQDTELCGAQNGSGALWGQARDAGTRDRRRGPAVWQKTKRERERIVAFVGRSTRRLLPRHRRAPILRPRFSLSFSFPSRSPWRVLEFTVVQLTVGLATCAARPPPASLMASAERHVRGRGARDTWTGHAAKSSELQSVKDEGPERESDMEAEQLEGCLKG